MESQAIKTSYARWAPIYDRTFGAVTSAGRRRAVAHINRRGGTVLEVGVGTGLALPLYGRHMFVTGIDFSEPMLAKARRKVEEQSLSQVTSLLQMDARALAFPDESFDTVAAMHILSVVPEPERVMAEIARVLKPGGEVVISNHFARDGGPLALAERLAAPFSDLLGWHSDFRIERILGEPALRVVEEQSFPPLGLMTFLVLRKSG